MRIIFVLPVTIFVISFSSANAQQPAIGNDTLKVKPKNADSVTFARVEIESEYPGGIGAWSKFLGATMHYPDKAIRKNIQGTVVIQFIVDKEGNVSDIEAISGPTEGGLREEGVRCIKKSGRWTPAVQDGRKVKSYKKQPFVFKLG